MSEAVGGWVEGLVAVRERAPHDDRYSRHSTEDETGDYHDLSSDGRDSWMTDRANRYSDGPPRRTAAFATRERSGVPTHVPLGVLGLVNSAPLTLSVLLGVTDHASLTLGVLLGLTDLPPHLTLGVCLQVFLVFPTFLPLVRHRGPPFRSELRYEAHRLPESSFGATPTPVRWLTNAVSDA